MRRGQREAVDAGPRDGRHEKAGDVGKTETLFGAPVYPGDTLSTYRNGHAVTVVNQRSEVVLTRTEKFNPDLLP